jgi:probable dihydroxyacetone kinase regulator
MSNPNITKAAIAAATKQVMEKTPLDKITTADIIAQCGISRKTFYYHFHDKYEVVNWVFTVDIIDGILKSTTFEDWAEGSYKLCRYIKDNKTFYKNAVNANGQNCFIQFLRTLTTLQLKKLCTGYLEKGILTDTDFNFLVEFYYNAFIGVFTPWVKDDMKENPDLLVKRWVGVVDKSLEHYISSIQSK